MYCGLRPHKSSSSSKFIFSYYLFRWFFFESKSCIFIATKVNVRDDHHNISGQVYIAFSYLFTGVSLTYCAETVFNIKCLKILVFVWILDRQVILKLRMDIVNQKHFSEFNGPCHRTDTSLLLVLQKMENSVLTSSQRMSLQQWLWRRPVVKSRTERMKRLLANCQSTRKRSNTRVQP